MILHSERSISQLPGRIRKWNGINHPNARAMELIDWFSSAHSEKSPWRWKFLPRNGNHDTVEPVRYLFAIQIDVSWMDQQQRTKETIAILPRKSRCQFTALTLQSISSQRLKCALISVHFEDNIMPDYSVSQQQRKRSHHHLLSSQVQLQTAAGSFYQSEVANRQ